MRFYITIIICLLCVENCFAQRMKSWTFTASDYTTDTLQMEGYTYICDTLKQALVTLRNIEDHPGREDLCYADGTPLEAELATSLHLEAVVITSGVDAHIQSIVNDAFSQQQAEQLDGSKLQIVLNISSSSGEVTDVYFNFLAWNGYAKIPIEVYRNMEVRFKSEICFELTDLGRQLNYCLLSWRQCPIGRQESEVVLPEDGGEQLEMPSGGLNNPTSGNLGTPAGNALGTPAGLP